MANVTWPQRVEKVFGLKPCVPDPLRIPLVGPGVQETVPLEAHGGVHPYPEEFRHVIRHVLDERGQDLGTEAIFVFGVFHGFPSFGCFCWPKSKTGCGDSTFCFKRPGRVPFRPF